MSRQKTLKMTEILKSRMLIVWLVEIVRVDKKKVR